MDRQQEERIISDFLQSLGPWKRVVVIGGGYALIIYTLYLLKQHTEVSPVGTRDIDSLIPRKVPEISKKNLSKYLQDAGFSRTFKNLDHPATENYVKEIDGEEIEIEFLTDSAARVDKHKNVLIAGVVAQPLNYTQYSSKIGFLAAPKRRKSIKKEGIVLTNTIPSFLIDLSTAFALARKPIFELYWVYLSLSLQMAREFKTFSGQSGWVVAPGAWMFHKGLTFTKRKNPNKTRKDLYGIWYVSTQLGEFSEDAISELQHLGLEYPKWFKTFRNNLLNWIDDAAPLDWTKLEAQDPSGKLERSDFQQIIKKICNVLPLRKPLF